MQQPKSKHLTLGNLQVLISKCLAYDPNKRPTARTVMDRLDKLRVTVQAGVLPEDADAMAAAGCFGGPRKPRKTADGGADLNSRSGSFTSNGSGPATPRRPSRLSRTTSGLFGRKSFSANDRPEIRSN